MKRRITVAAVLACVLNGCFLLYLPILILVPFQPLLRLAVKLAVRYGPLLLLMAETDPQMAPGGGALIAVQPAAITERATANVCGIQAQLLGELSSNTSLRSIGIVEARRLSDAWFEQFMQDAAARGCRVRVVFVDSRMHAAGAPLPAALQARLAAADVPVIVTEGLAASVVGAGVATIPAAQATNSLLLCRRDTLPRTP